VTYLLDTDHISVLLRQVSPEHASLRHRLDLLSEYEFGLSVVSLHEQMMRCNAYIARNRHSDVLRGCELIQSLIDVYCPAQIVDYDGAAISEFEKLRALRIRIATMDLRIAAIAFANGFVLLTRNSKDFSRVPGLRFEDWTIA
jgi:tRNA(fMet)-specific endonuclease VapC